MNKVITASLLVVTVLSGAFGLYQKNRADEFEKIAILNEKRAREMADNATKAQAIAEQQRKMAEQQMAMAMMNMERAKEAVNRAEQLLTQSKKSKR